MRSTSDDVFWHGPGLRWIRTPSGWRKDANVSYKSETEDGGCRSSNQSPSTSVTCRYRDLIGCSQPFVYPSAPNASREVTRQQVTLTEVLSRMELENAIKDTRRFLYVCKILELVMEKKFHRLSGMAQKRVMVLLDCVLDQVLDTELYISRARSLIDTTEAVLIKQSMDHMGGRRLWEQHLDGAHRMKAALHSLNPAQRCEDGCLMLSDLPEDIITEILLRLDNEVDITNFACTETRTHMLAEGDQIWQSLCLFHYGEHLNGQLIKNAQKIGWKKTYYQLSKKYPHRDNYAETLSSCTYCSAIFWQHHGHPCLESREQNTGVKVQEIPISPEECIQMFTA